MCVCGRVLGLVVRGPQESHYRDEKIVICPRKKVATYRRAAAVRQAPEVSIIFHEPLATFFRGYMTILSAEPRIWTNPKKQENP